MIGKLIGKKVSSSLAEKKFLIIGVVLCIGSVGLLLGAITCAVSAVFFVYGQMSLVVSMVWGFFITGFLTLLTGMLLVMTSSE